MSLYKRMIAELFGTFWLVFGGCGAAVLAAGYPALGIGFAGVALAFGLTVLTMAFAIGHVSGCHLNPAVSIGLVVAKRFPARELPSYIIAQLLGGILGAGALYAIASGKAGFSLAGEAVCTAFFLLVILGSTDHRAPKGFAPVAIGLGLTLIHLISIPVTNTSVNPARSTATALFVHGWALSQLWLFWVAPIFGAIAGAVISNVFFAAPQEPLREAMAKD
jgi:aquaporin Z